MAEANESGSTGLTPDESLLIKETFAWMHVTMGDGVFQISDNDWNTIVKLHAMIETALNDVLTRQFQCPELSRVISKLDTTSNPATGKVAFAKALRILRPETAVFIQKMSELRNFCVHDVRNFNFDLNQHLASLSEDKRSELMKPIRKVLRPERREILAPKGMLFAGTMRVMFEIQIYSKELQIRDLRAALHQKQSELYERGQSKPKKD